MFNLTPEHSELVKLDRIRARQFRNGHDLISRVGNPLSVYEQCRILRWREGWTIAQLAKRMKTSKVSVIRYERGEWSHHILEMWWRKRLKG